MREKYEVDGKRFSFRCDANEYSFQLCNKALDTMPLDSLRVKQFDDHSYGVYDLAEKHFVVIFKVKLLL